MPLWTVQTENGEEHRAEADMLVTEAGALIALSEEGLLTRAWAAGQWRSAQLLTGVQAHPAGGTSEGHADFHDNVLMALPER
jgi:hypothetical protein